MYISIGKQYINKTWRFLVPCLRAHGNDFVKHFNPPLFKLGVGIYDKFLSTSKIASERNIYVMVDKLFQPDNYQKVINYFQSQNYFRGKYSPNYSTLSRKEIIVIRIPEIFYDAYDNFLQGKYSKMYTEKQIRLLFCYPGKEIDYQIVSKTGINALNNYIKVINSKFNVNTNPKNFKNAEWDFPLERNQEMFNCDKIQRIYFNKKLDKI